MRYPIAGYQPRLNDFDTATDSAWLEGLDGRRLDLSWFDGLRIFDAAGFERTVRRARVVRESRWPLGLRHHVDLALDFEEAGRSVPLVELAGLVFEASATDSSFWEWNDDPTPKEAFLSRISSARKHDELIRVLHEPKLAAP